MDYGFKILDSTSAQTSNTTHYLIYNMTQVDFFFSKGFYLFPCAASLTVINVESESGEASSILVYPVTFTLVLMERHEPIFSLPPPPHSYRSNSITD